MQGMLTGLMLAVAPIAGETAPLLFTALNNQFWTTNMNAPMANLPVVIFQFAMSPYADWQTLAWGGALLIPPPILLLNISPRTLAAWSSFKQLTPPPRSHASTRTTTPARQCPARAPPTPPCRRDPHPPAR